MARSTKILFPLVALGLLSSLAVGCGSDPATDAGVADSGTPGTDTGVVTPVDAGAPQTFDYVINHLTLDEGAEPGTTTRAFYGFDLDGRQSPNSTAHQQPTDCSHGDYFSTVDPDQNGTSTCMAGMAAGGTGCTGGVDNQLPNVAQTIEQFSATTNVQTILNEQVTTGKFLILVRISDVNGTLGPTLNDPSVHISVYPYAYATVADCATIQNAGQTYQVDDRSLLTAGDLGTARLQYEGSIVNGRVHVTPPAATATTPNFSLPLSIMGTTLTLNLYGTQLRVTPGDTDGTNGNLGGYLKQQDLISALTTIPALMQFQDAAGPLIAGFVDIATGTPPACEGPTATPSSEGGIGVGLGFTTKRATISPTTVMTAPTGVCGGAT